jgi:hypothetical protein
MKKHILLLLSLVFAHVTYSQTDKQIAETDKIVNDIKNNRANYQQTKIVEDSISYIYIYKKDTELKLEMMNYKDRRYDNRYIDKKVDYYFSNGHLIFVEQTWTDILPNKVVDNQKMYLDEKHMLAWIKNQNETVDVSSKEFKDIETEALAYGIKLVSSTK